MRFSRSFLQRQELSWAASYARYDQFKAILKLALASPPHASIQELLLETLYTLVCDDLASVGELLEQLYAAIATQEQQLHRTYDFLHHLSDGKELMPSGNVSAHDCQHALYHIVSLERQILAVQSFGEANARAFSQMLQKLVRAAQVIESPAVSAIANLLEFHASPPTVLQEKAALNNKVMRALGRSIVVNYISVSPLDNLANVTDETPLQVSMPVYGCGAPARRCDELITATKYQNECLVQWVLQEGANVDAVEQYTGRTALWYACNNGDSALVRLLLEAGADPKTMDLLGWTPHERVGHHGYEGVLDLLRSHACLPLKPEEWTGLGTSLGTAVEQSRLDRVRVAKPVRNYSGHRTLQSGETKLVVNIGSLQGRESIPAIELDAPLRAEDGSLFLRVSVIGGSGDSPRHFPLPIMEDLSNEPCIFSARRPERVGLKFDLQTMLPDVGTTITLGTATVLVDALLKKRGSMLENVARDHKVAFFNDQRCAHIGTLVFTLLIVTPLPPQVTCPRPIPWSFGNGIGGHRGLGLNKPEWKYLQLGENTVHAFDTAKRLGASFVELDVQMTKDRVPVVYHDFLVSETGVDAPVHAVDFEQFSHVSELQRPDRMARNPSYDRSSSLHKSDRIPLDSFNARMARTVEWRMNSFKPNTRGAFIHERFITLEECLRDVDPEVYFDIEVKYPMYFETEQYSMDPNFPLINDYVDIVLAKIFECAGERRIMLCSFSAEMCILMSMKQSTYPVFYCNDGRWPSGDSRAGSLQEAIHFAKRWALAGIVMESRAFVECPRLVEYARSFGLLTATYGPANNEPEAVQSQFDAGVDGVICDRVHLIYQKCRRKDAASPPKTPGTSTLEANEDYLVRPASQPLIEEAVSGLDIAGLHDKKRPTASPMLVPAVVKDPLLP